MLDELLVSVNLGIMWARRDCPMLLEAQSKARALWKGKDKQWTGLRNPKSHKSGYLDHQLMIQDEFARTGRADCMMPLETSPFPRWAWKWAAQLAGRELCGVALPAQASITSQSFTCNVWDGHWPVKESDGLARWVESFGATAPAQDSGESSGVPPAKLQDASVCVVSAFPRLVESGVPAAIAFRAQAAAIQAMARTSAKCAFAATWPAEQVAFGFLSGALKAEWVREPCSSNLEEGKPPCISNQDGSLGALAESFGLTREFQKSGALAFDCMFVGATFVDNLPETPRLGPKEF